MTISKATMSKRRSLGLTLKKSLLHKAFRALAERVQAAEGSMAVRWWLNEKAGMTEQCGGISGMR